MATMTEIPGDLRTIADAAKETGIPERRIRFWADHGTIGRWRKGGYRIMVSLDEVRRRESVEPYPPQGKGEQE